MVYNKTTTISFPGSSISPITTGIVNGSLVVREILTTDTITFGEINSNQFQCQLYDCPDLTGKKIQVTQTNNDTSTTDYIFTGWVDSCRTDDLTGFKTIIAYDYFYRFRNRRIKKWWKQFWNNVPTDTTKVTLGEIWRSLFSYYNLSYINRTMICDSITYTKKGTKKYKISTFNNFITQLCEINLLIPNVRRDGTIEFISLSDWGAPYYDGDIRGDYNIKNSTFEDYTVPPYNRISLYGSDNELLAEAGSSQTIDDDKNILSIQNNMFLFNKKDTTCLNIAMNMIQNMHEFEYIPASVEMKLSQFNIELGHVLRTEKGLIIVCENNLTGPMLVNQKLVSNDKADGTEVTNNKASEGEKKLGTANVRDIDRVDFNVDTNMPDLTVAKLDDGRVALRDPKLVDEEGGTVSRTFYLACYNFAWAPAQGIWKQTLAYADGSWLLCNSDDGNPYVTVNGIVRNWGYIFAFVRCPHVEHPPNQKQFPFSRISSELVWSNQYHPDATQPGTTNFYGLYKGTKDGYDYYYVSLYSVGSVSPQMAYEYSKADYTYPSTEDAIYDLLYTDNIKWSDIQTGDSILPSATEQEKAAVAAENLAKKVAGQSGTNTPTGAYENVNVATDSGMNRIADGLNAVNTALDGNAKSVTVSGSAGAEVLKTATYGGTETTLLAANPTGEATQTMNKLQVGSTVYELGGGVSDYDELTDKPSINGVTLSGDKASTELDLWDELTQAEFNQLSQEEKETAEKIYFIPDGGGSGGGGAEALEDLTDVDIDNLQDGEVLKYNGTSGKWENGTGGGGGSDLEMEIVDGAIQATYGASTEESGDILKDTTGIQIANLIDDIAKSINLLGNPEVYAPVVYSTEEREVGVAENGKPLYQKTIKSGLLAADSNTATGLTNIDTFHLTSIKAIQSSGTQNAPMYISMYNYQGAGTYYGLIYLENNSLYYSNMSRTNQLYIEAVVQYTKTTDIAGSGNYAALGVPAVHYSTSEQVIGTWIDGKPLYQKVIDLGSSITFQPNRWTTISGVTMVGCRCIKTDAVDYQNPYSNTFPVALSIDETTGQIDLNQFRSTTISVRYLIVQYTKTTD